MYVITVAMQKGGVGKSTTVQNVANVLGEQGYKVLVIDLDAQGNTTFSSGLTGCTEETITDVLEREKVGNAVRKMKYFDIIPSDTYLSNVEKADISNNLLDKAINKAKKDYDFVIIDTPPNLGNLVINALYASDYVLIPCLPTIYAMQGLIELDKTIKGVKKVNKKLKILGVVVVRFKGRINLNNAIMDGIKATAKKMQTEVFNSVIRESIAVDEAQTEQVPLNDYKPHSNPCIDYKGLVAEILEKIESR